MSRHARLLPPTATRRLYASASQRFVAARKLNYDGKNSIEGFDANEPAVFTKCPMDVPAVDKWFANSSTSRYPVELDATYLEKHGDTIVTLEMTRSPKNGSQSTFERFEAPLSLLLTYMNGPEASDTRLYLAQHSLADLPETLQADLPIPMSFLSHLGGRGDIYASSLWMGRPPTRTPLHRDPNPNLFVQLAGEKIVRLMRPEVGRAMYERVRFLMRRSNAAANMRGEEMMVGSEMEALEQAVWSDGDGQVPSESGVEASLGRGDALYIPLGWWHAVRGVGQGANASANWWFR